MSVENKIKPLPSGERLDTKTNDDGIMDFLSDSSFVEESYNEVPENFDEMLPSDLNGYGSWATAEDDYDIGYVEEEMENSAGMNYDPQPRRHIVQQRPAQRPSQRPMQNPMSNEIMNRRPGDRRNRPVQQPQPTGFKNSEELYKMFKLFILGPVSLNPGFDFEELLDVLDDMKDMAELVASQKTRKRKLSGSSRREEYLPDFEDEDLEELDDIGYDF